MESFAIALLLTALSTVEGDTCGIILSMIRITGPSSFRRHSDFGFVLNGVSLGGKPTYFTWEKDGVSLSSLSNYTIGEPEQASFDYVYNPVNIDELACHERIYISRLTVKGKHAGHYSYTVNNEETVTDKTDKFTIEDADPPTKLELRLIGSNGIEINWTPPANPPSAGYLISLTKPDLGFAGTLVANPPYTLVTAVGGTYNISVVSHSQHFISDILGPKSITLPFRTRGLKKFLPIYSKEGMMNSSGSTGCQTIPIMIYFISLFITL